MVFRLHGMHLVQGLLRRSSAAVLCMLLLMVWHCCSCQPQTILRASSRTWKATMWTMSWQP